MLTPSPTTPAGEITVNLTQWTLLEEQLDQWFGDPEHKRHELLIHVRGMRQEARGDVGKIPHQICGKCELKSHAVAPHVYWGYICHRCDSEATGHADSLCCPNCEGHIIVTENYQNWCWFFDCGHFWRSK